MKRIGIIAIFVSFFLININAQSNNVKTIIQEGVKLHDAKEYKKAIAKFEQALKVNPKSIQATYEISLSYLELKDYRNASKYSTQVINANDKNLSVGAYAVKSEALAEMNQINTAISLLQEGLAKNGDSYLLHFNMALNYYKKGDLEKTLKHVGRAIELNKTSSGAFLLSAYAQKDKGLWLKSIFSFQVFLLLEPDSQRSKNAYEEMLQTMQIVPTSDKPIERSFIQQQLAKGKNIQSKQKINSNNENITKTIIYKEITKTIDSLKSTNNNKLDLYTAFKEVNKNILINLDNELGEQKKDNFWSFHYPFLKSILNSQHYETYCRYISVSYFPESIKWWENNKKQAQEFINWFEKGDNNKKVNK